MSAFDLQAFLGLSGLHLPENGTEGRRPTSFVTANHPQDILGFASLGIPICLDASDLIARDDIYPEGVAVVSRLAGTGMPVFIASGTQHEYAIGTAFDCNSWRLRMDLYDHLAHSLSCQLYVAAPDKLGDQTETISRLQMYAYDIMLISRRGANIVLNLCEGEMAPDEFQMVAQDILHTKVTPAFAMQDGLTSPDVVIAFVRATMPEKLHLTGMTPGPAADALLQDLWEIHPTLMISRDMQVLRTPDGVDPLIDDNLAHEAMAPAELPFADLWRGWLVREAFDHHPMAHQYPHVEVQVRQNLGSAPDVASEPFQKDLAFFKTFHGIQEDTAH